MQDRRDSEGLALHAKAEAPPKLPAGWLLFGRQDIVAHADVLGLLGLFEFVLRKLGAVTGVD